MIILIYYGIIILLAFATWYLPFGGKILALGINFFIPEGLPFLDEFIQMVGVLKHTVKIKKRFLS